MATMTKEPPQQAYEMPFIQEGDIVLWHPGGINDDRSLVALVTKVNARSISLNAFEPNLLGHHCMDGVRHHNDPWAKDIERIQFGTWEQSHHQITTRSLLERIEKLEAQVAELKKK